MEGAIFIEKTEYVVTREYGEQDFGVIFLHFLKNTCQNEDSALQYECNPTNVCSENEKEEKEL